MKRGMWNPEYKAWHDAVFERDGNLCCRCGAEAKHAHHIVGWWVDKTKRFDIDNGMALCVACHSKIHGRDLSKECFGREKSFAWYHVPGTGREGRVVTPLAVVVNNDNRNIS